MRSLALVFLSFCLALSGTVSALPESGMAMGSTMEATTQAASMMPDCPDIAAVAAMPAADDGAGPVEGKKPDCCQGESCACAVAHCVFLVFSSPPPSHSVPTATTIVVFDDSGYTSPALARLIRPPVS